MRNKAHHRTKDRNSETDRTLQRLRGEVSLMLTVIGLVDFMQRLHTSTIQNYFIIADEIQ